MSKNKPNKYWLNKIRLWFALHGNRRVSEYQLCNLCHNCIKEGVNSSLGTRVQTLGCQRKNNYQGRLMYKRDFSDIRFDPTNLEKYESDWVCAEWVKDV